jgi:uncharacterized membrane protein
MNRIEFLRTLHDELDGRLADQDIEEILADYMAYFDEAQAEGRSEQDVATALGDPRRLARELHAETRLRQWESNHSLRNSATALLALGGLAAVDLFLLLPLIFAAGIALLVSGVLTFALGIAGIGTLFSLLKIAAFASITKLLLRAIVGLALLTASAGVGTAVLLSLNAAVKALGNYARLHYRLLKPEQHAG